MEDCVSLLSTQPFTTAVRAAPRTDTLAQLLAQGLQSNDTRILDSVLDGADFELIDNMVIRIPAKVPLVSVLQKYIKGRGMVHASHNKQLKTVLRLLCSADHPQRVPGCQNLLSPVSSVYAILESRTQHYNQVLQLKASWSCSPGRPWTGRGTPWLSQKAKSLSIIKMRVLMSWKMLLLTCLYLVVILMMTGTKRKIIKWREGRRVMIVGIVY